MDILRELGIDLIDKNRNVLDLVKSNPYIMYIEDEDSKNFFLKSSTMLDVHNKSDLLNLIDRVKTGVSRNKTKSCYNGVKEDIEEMMCSGEVIANKNKDKDRKDIILYPRGKPLFLTELSGTGN